MLHLQTSKNGPFKSTTLSHKFLHSTILPVLLIFELVYTGAKKLPDINWESRNTMSVFIFILRALMYINIYLVNQHYINL